MDVRLHQDPQRGDHMNPFGKTKGGAKMYWIVGGLVVLMIVALFAF
jgi:hypothetical protein